MEVFEPHNPLVVEAETYTNEYFILGEEFYFFKRCQILSQEKEDIDAFGHFWALAVGDLQPGQVQIRKGGDWIPVVGLKLIWIPPHSVMHWRLGPGSLEWYSYISSLPAPTNLPTDPVMFSMPEFSWPRSPADIETAYTHGSDHLALTPVTRNPWALKLKKKIDLEFNENHKMDDYAKQFSVAHETMTRAFHEEYGLAPIQYRNKMRLTQAMVDILMTGKRISEISQALGFRDQSHFNQLFRREIRSNPSRFKL